MPFPTSQECITAAEAGLGIQLPSVWAARLLRANGGELELADEEWQLFPVPDTSDRKRAGRTANHIVQENAAAHRWRGFPSEAVAIAANGSGHYLVLLPAPDAPERLDDRVYRWDHETTELEEVGRCEQFAE